MSPSAVQAARQRHQRTLESLHAGTLLIAGVRYTAAVTRAAAAREMMPDGSGSVLVQRATATVRKAILPTAPVRGTVVTIEGIEWHIDSVAGDDPQAPAWFITLHRFPG
ncbi:MAG: hypothetical protein KCHDKBKB_03010 [Elusimicrobia bacterium]|nr:hypothetical protein [Elusimicrobiota bacterium]